jgi:hypothetical protein
MKTILEIPEPLYRQATERAVQIGQSVVEFTLGLLRRELARPSATTPADASGQNAGLYTTTQQGFLVLKRSSDDKTVITHAQIDQMREELGV